MWDRQRREPAALPPSQEDTGESQDRNKVLMLVVGGCVFVCVSMCGVFKVECVCSMIPISWLYVLRP